MQRLVRRPFILLGLLSLLLGACEDRSPGPRTFPERDFTCDTRETPCPTRTPARSDDERTVFVTFTPTSVTRTYVVTRLSLPASDDTSVVRAGFNLDGLDSGLGTDAPDATCEEFNQDFSSALDPQVGVDSAFAELVPTGEGLLDAARCPGGNVDGCLDVLLAAEIRRPDQLLIVEVSGIDSFENDLDVEVTVHVATTLDGADPTLDPDGWVSPGQSFRSIGEHAARAHGDIFDGRLRVVFEELRLLPDALELTIPVLLSHAELRADISEDGLTHAQLGGATEVERMVRRAETFTSDPVTVGGIRGILSALADMDPSPRDPQVCLLISSGWELDAVTATLVAAP